jgi:dTMP kinase
MATGGLEPDLTFVLDLPMQSAQSRRKADADRMERKGDAYFTQVRTGFLAEALRRPDKIRIVDAALPVDEVQALLRAGVAQWTASN